MGDWEKPKEELINELNALRQRIRSFEASSERQQIKQSDLEVIDKLETPGRLAGRIAHEFNNILTAVAGNISLAKMYAKPGLEVFDILEEAEKASLRAKYLVQQLLPLSQTGMPVKKVIPVTGLVRDIAGFALSGSQVRCDFSIADDLWAVSADEGQLRQVIQALILNAMQGMPKGGIINVGAENVTIGADKSLPLREGKYIKIAIVDQGPGIPEEDLQRIFDPYFRTKKGEFSIGLAAVHPIIKKHNGYITVESASGVGTTFSLFLPAYEEIPGAFEDEKETPFPYQGTGRVLVMDDEAIVRVVIGRMLSQCGYESGFAKDGEEAIEEYKQAMLAGKPFDAVIIDLIVPDGMGGKETIKKLLEIDPDVRAVVSSGYSNDPIMANYGDYGFKSFLSKPYNMEQLYQVLEQVKR